MQRSGAHAAYGDSSTGTPVSLVVAPGQSAPGTSTPGHTAPPHHGPLPFTGVELLPQLALAALLVAGGAVVARLARRPVPVPVRVRDADLPTSSTER